MTGVQECSILELGKIIGNKDVVSQGSLHVTVGIGNTVYPQATPRRKPR